MRSYIKLNLIVTLAFSGCQTSSTCSPCQKPPLGQRLFGTTQKPGSITVSPPPGVMTGPQPPSMGASVTPAFQSAPPSGPFSMAPIPPNQNPATNFGGNGPIPVTTNKLISPPTVYLGAPEISPSPKNSPVASNPSSFPVDIPGYAVLSDKIAGGHQPFPDGVAWLKEAGFYLVIHLRHENENAITTRELVEKYGLNYRSIEIEANKLDSATLAGLDRDIQSANGKPVFIFDKDGLRTGAVWIAYATKYLGIEESISRDQSARLGYRKETAGQTWEISISELLKNR
ncbi:MAG: hypothetical protein ACKO26_23320 [Planctomycetota bacterium]